MANKRIEEGAAFIEAQIAAMHAKLGSGEVELSQYISFVELSTKALKVLKALEAELEEGK